MASSNEGRCLDAVLRVLEKQLSVSRHVLERDTPAQRGIELVCMLGDQRYALEHTIIEPFPDNMKDDISFGRVFDDNFENEVGDLLSTELAYDLHVNVYAFAGMSAKKIASARQSLIAWTRETIPGLPVPTAYQQTAIAAEPPKVPVSIRLACHRSKGLGGRLLAGRFAPESLESLRRQRLLKALNDKVPKLHVANRPGTHTVLVLENGDIALTNEGLTSELIDELGHQVANMPDEVYLVGTYIAQRFYVTRIRCEGKACLDMGEDWDFEAASLQDI